MDFLNEIASKWQKVWDSERVYEADVDRTKEKKFITVAFPYTNSPLHIGHGRTYITADIYARYLRMKGYNVLFPFAFQFTGTPILSIADAVKRGDEEIISTFTNVYQIPIGVISKFSDPSYLSAYFKEDMRNTALTLGLSIDRRREFTTIDPAFERFVQWQYKRLQEIGYIKKEKAPVAYCPVDEFPVGMHDTRGDIEPEIIDLDVIYFQGEKLLFLTATSRPETIFGAVAILINPDSDYSIVVDNKNGKRLVMSTEAFKKLSFQMSLTEEERKKGGELIGLNVTNPVTLKKLTVLPSKYVESKQGTGVVMAVPAHEPLHYLALSELKESFEIVPVIKSEDYGDFPAMEVLETAQTTSAQELKDYIDTLYRIEFHKGSIRDEVVDLVPDYMKQFVGERIAGKSVREARSSVVELLRNLGVHGNIYEIINGPVYCRCGAEVVVKVFDDQWFIDYSNSTWKSSVLKSLDKIEILPQDAKREISKIIFNMKPRPFTRSRGLGVRLPWDDRQIIDSLSDSTIYTVFYIVANKVKSYPTSILNERFWDYVVLGRGDSSQLSRELGIPKEQLEELRMEVEYWYPVDSRHSGRDLVQNHIPYYLYHHVGVLGEDKVPKRIVLNGFIRVGGKKMSKSFGNVYPLNKAIREYGVDTVRLALTSTSSLSDDIEFSPNIAKSIGEQLKHIHDFIENLIKLQSVNEIRKVDLWISSLISEYIDLIDNCLSNLDLRTAYKTIYYDIYEDLKDYLELGNGKINSDIIKNVISVWIRLMAPFTPHLAEELWHKLDNSLVVRQRFPSKGELQYDKRALLEIEYLRYTIDLINSMKSKMSKEPETVIIYVNEDNTQRDLIRKAIESLKERKSLPDFEKEVGDREMARLAYEIAGDLPDKIKNLAEIGINESEILTSNAQFLLNKLDVKEIYIYNSKDPSTPDIKGKKSIALPYKPGIILT
ncbi:leucine--tRNA ligase [Sulfolobus acidocaldarius]|uniref:Leucine--tRNA ligase 1 n=4 Tax=Sulfolobus acidocaldarius TaxID=2285 RepID=SYL1_SULAC|nr:leucine--tRNA ligase [Sulfolobus acidocaldarius]Q4JBP0.1 RecName: Full=Leucine--tRNA ligase 1; AltName: Full=Leucyl-tRNA synthetase 1; Short=LeuRS 1 [Sulfolobus acidocaldarius DSM 639]AAY79789.1 leucyl-tRNA synthetase [Sulfolobus acidocaldarius DSM 639]AGE70347.1 leucyl-tRNA synthetase [Sulfolobus acidocaldarius N8]AGE72622.1 leucyl-tRNA synthetase [Sulfolobus acidocaldarius Ron12/I]ALU29254.1 leucine--tRNA ligase [Sulfolobus acidocaldarius]ALU31983.1 leucine--tRNA ligase [Sulfolobus acido